MTQANNSLFLAAQDDLYSQAWNQLVNDPDDLIMDLLVDKARELTTPDIYEPKKEDAQRFLSTYLEQAKINVFPASESRRFSRRHRTGKAKPSAFTFNNQRYELDYNYEYLVKFAELLSKIRRDRFEEVLTLRPRGQRIYFSKNPADLSRPQLVPETNIYVHTNISLEVAKVIAKRLAEHFEVDEPIAD